MWRQELACLTRHLRRRQHIDGRGRGLDHVVEGVVHHAPGGQQDAVADSRGPAPETVDGTVYEDSLGTVRPQAVDSRALLSEGGRAADLDVAAAGRPADHPGTQGSAKRQLLADVPRVQ